jgi:peptide chain release factor
MLRFPVSEQKQADLNERMRQLQLADGELEESYFKASSPGGQKANKTLTGVNLMHRPTGLRVRCQRERSQGINRFLARRLLVEELEARRNGKTRHSAKAERIRAEKDRRRGSRKRGVTGVAGTVGAGSFIPSPDAVFDLAKAMAAYYLRPLMP